MFEWCISMSKKPCQLQPLVDMAAMRGDAKDIPKQESPILSGLYITELYYYSSLGRDKNAIKFWS